MSEQTISVDARNEEEFKPDNLLVSMAPHYRAADSVEKIMWTVVACLVPPLVLSVSIFGVRALLVTMVSVLSCIATEAICHWFMKKPMSTVKDGSAVITGLLLAYTIPPGVPLWTPILGAVVAIFLTKTIMGGLGFNIFNPALIGRAFLVASYPVAMTSAWLAPRTMDALTSATPLYLLRHYGTAELVSKYGSMNDIYSNFFFGIRPGCIGETSALLLLIGGAVLLYKRYITWHIPVSILASTALLTWIFGGDKLCTGDPLLAVLSGGLILGAFFMATDYVTSPMQPKGKLIFGVGIGVLPVIIRLRGGYPEGVCYAILLMNSIAPALDTWFKPRRFAPQQE